MEGGELNEDAHPIFHDSDCGWIIINKSAELKKLLNQNGTSSIGAMGKKWLFMTCKSMATQAYCYRKKIHKDYSILCSEQWS